MRRSGMYILTVLMLLGVALPASKANAATPISTISVSSVTPTTITTRCITQANGYNGQVFVAYKLPSELTYSLTTKNDDQAFFTPTTPSNFTSIHTPSALTPNTTYDLRCRVRYLENGVYKIVNGPSTSATTLPDAPQASIVVSKNSLNVTEPGSQDNLSIALSSQPISDVILNISSSDTSEGVVTPSTLVFTPANWSTQQTLQLTAADDAELDGTKSYDVTVAVDPSSSAEYAILAPTVTSATTLDNETPPSAPITLTAVGDLCKLNSPLSCKKTADQSLALNPDFHIMLGDVQYGEGTYSQINSAYDVSWNNLKSRTLPVIGNHEQKDKTTPLGYCRYFDSALNKFCIAGTNYSYSKDLGSGWTLISMESTGPVTTQQVQQLNNFIDAAGSNNIVFAFHEPRFSSLCTGTKCHGDNTKVQSLWEVAVSRGVDVVLNGHDHKYERFYPLNATGQPVSNGLISFVNGMGADINDPGCDTTRNLSKSAFCAGDGSVTDPALRINDRVSAGGNIYLILNQSSFSWEFREADGPNNGIGRLVDSGTAMTRPNQ